MIYIINLYSSVEDMTLLPPSGFSDGRELSEAECDRDCAWQRLTTHHGGSLGRLSVEAAETLISR